jgi:MFS family permease
LRQLSDRLPEPYRRLIVPVYVPSFLMAVSQEALLVLLPLYVIELGYGAVYAAFVVGLRGIGVLLFDVPAGMLVARLGEKPVLLLGLGSVCLGLMLLAASANTIAIGVAAILLGIGFAAWMLGRQSYISATCAAEETGRAIAVMAGVQRGGAFVGPILGGFVALHAGYAAAFGVGAVCALLAGWSVYRFATDIEVVDEPREGWRGSANVLREHAKTFATTGVAALILQLMRATRQLLVPLFGAALGLDVATIGTIYSISAAVDMSLFLPVGMLIDRRGRKWSAVPTMLLFSIGLGLLPFATSAVQLGAVAIVLGLANGCGTGIVMIMGADLARQARHRSQFLGVWRLLGDSGMSSAPLITSALTNFGGLAAASLTVASFGVIGVVLTIFFVTETLRPPAR